MKILFLAIMATVAQGQVCRIVPDSASSEVNAASTWEVSWQPSDSRAVTESK